MPIATVAIGPWHAPGELQRYSRSPSWWGLPSPFWRTKPRRRLGPSALDIPPSGLTLQQLHHPQ